MTETNNKKDFLSKFRENPWIVSTAVLGILFVATLFFSFGSGASIGGSAASEKEVGEKIVNFLNSQVQQGQVELQSVEKDKGLYKVTVLYQGDSIPVYATLDGENLVYQLVPLDAAVQGNVNTNANTQQQKVEIDSEKIKNAPVKGNANAPVTIVEFSDYECPFCFRFYSETLGLIDENYIKTGKVKLVFMDFPLSFHPNAQKSAEAVRCFEKVKGGSDVEYFKYHDKLFENQESLSIENFKAWARELGANGAQFDSCLDSGEFADEVQADLDYGASVGVQGTPAFFIFSDSNNVQLVSGAQPYANFKQVIDAELAG